MGTGYANLPLCKSQQGYSPQGEGELFAVPLKIRATGFTKLSSARLESAMAVPSPNSLLKKSHRKLNVMG
jgi:hypothetical protein